MPISNLIGNLTENITQADVQMSFGEIMLNTNMSESLIDIGKNFIPSDSSPLGKKIFNPLTDNFLLNYLFSNDSSIFYVVRYSDDPTFNLRWNSKYDSLSCRKVTAFRFPWLESFWVHINKVWPPWTIKRRMHQILQSKVSLWSQFMQLSFIS